MNELVEAIKYLNEEVRPNFKDMAFNHYIQYELEDDFAIEISNYIKRLKTTIEALSGHNEEQFCKIIQCPYLLICERKTYDEKPYEKCSAYQEKKTIIGE